LQFKAQDDVNMTAYMFVFLALKTVVVVFFHSPVAGFSLLVFEVS
jgi:hypothetical protein